MFFKPLLPAVTPDPKDENERYILPPPVPLIIDPIATLKIVVLEGYLETVRAQFNPKEVQFDQQSTWSPSTEDTGTVLEYGKRTPSSMSFELLFDGFEQTDESGTSTSDVEARLQTLKQLLRPMANSGDKKRPPKVKIVWGPQCARTMPRFIGVIESLSIKYTMFHRDGSVLRATANVKLKEASDLTVGKKT